MLLALRQVNPEWIIKLLNVKYIILKFCCCFLYYLCCLPIKISGFALKNQENVSKITY